MADPALAGYTADTTSQAAGLRLQHAYDDVRATLLASAQACCRDIASFLKTNPDAWSQGVAARTGDGYPISWDSPHARRFCAMALIEKFSGTVARSNLVTKLVTDALHAKRPGLLVHQYNDAITTHRDDVVALFELAGGCHLPSQRPSDSGAAEEAAYDAMALESTLSKLVPWEKIMHAIKQSAASV